MRTCRRGHLVSPDDDYVAPDGRRRCRECRRVQDQKRASPTPTPAERIAAKITPQGDCLIWAGAKDGNGYGVIQIQNRIRGVHRVVWELHHGRELATEEQIRHACDTPLCVNIAHLDVGTNADNVRDKMVRGRHGCPRGEKHPKAKLTASQVVEIRRRHAAGESGYRLARVFDVTQVNISSIVRRETWNYPGL